MNAEVELIRGRISFVTGLDKVLGAEGAHWGLGLVSNWSGKDDADRPSASDIGGL